MLTCGIDLRDKKQHEQLQQELQGKHCPYCRAVNRPDARFCRECKLVLTTEAYNETIEEADKTKKEFEQLKENQ